MAVKTVRICDICTDGETAAIDTIRWRHEGKGYEAEVCELHKAERKNLDLALEHWDANARELSSTRTRYRSQEVTERNRKIREWANANGYSIGGRGALGPTVREAYARAHPDAASAPTPESAPAKWTTGAPQAVAATG